MIEKDIFIRYGMDTKIWQDSQRNYFPYNLNINTFNWILLFTPILFLMHHLTVNTKFEMFKLMIVILFISSVGYYLSDRSIKAFGQTLCNKGLFGRDLNKAGI